MVTTQSKAPPLAATAGAQIALNWVGGNAVESRSGERFEKLNPTDATVLAQVARSGAEDVEAAVQAAAAAFPSWSTRPGVARGEVLYAIADRMLAEREQLAAVIALETGKSLASARGETDGAIALARFMAGEGQRLYGRTTTSAVAGKWAMTIREPLGVAGLIVAANTPIANVAWKVFPALICGNTAVLKAAEDAPLTASLFARIASEAGLPAGVLNVIHGFGTEAGEPLVTHPLVSVLSFTGSTAVGRRIAGLAGPRMARLSLELGGKNPFVVCEDADQAAAEKWALLSAFSNAGQRCASGSRIIILDAIYEEFRERLVTATGRLKVGSADTDDLGPVINERQLNNMLAALERARTAGSRVLTGGTRLQGTHAKGFFLAPTIVEDDQPNSELSCTELFGPITSLYRARDLDHAIELANASPYGLTAAIHTRNLHRALEFVRRVQCGVAVVNGGTFGSEPHMPFGGVKQSGNGSREPGTEALDIYSNLKDVYLLVDEAAARA